MAGRSAIGSPILRVAGGCSFRTTSSPTGSARCPAKIPGASGIVLVENPWKPARRPYHKQKLALVLANLRHFALEQAARGVAIRHVAASGRTGPRSNR